MYPRAYAHSMRGAGLFTGGLALLAIGLGLVLSLVSVEIGLLLVILAAAPLGLAVSRSSRRS